MAHSLAMIDGGREPTGAHFSECDLLAGRFRHVVIEAQSGRRSQRRIPCPTGGMTARFSCVYPWFVSARLNIQMVGSNSGVSIKWFLKSDPKWPTQVENVWLSVILDGRKSAVALVPGLR
jgi:hypothetical protein